MNYLSILCGAIFYSSVFKNPGHNSSLFVFVAAIFNLRISSLLGHGGDKPRRFVDLTWIRQLVPVGHMAATSVAPGVLVSTSHVAPRPRRLCATYSSMSFSNDIDFSPFGRAGHSVKAYRHTNRFTFGYHQIIVKWESIINLTSFSRKWFTGSGRKCWFTFADDILKSITFKVLGPNIYSEKQIVESAYNPCIINQYLTILNGYEYVVRTRIRQINIISIGFI